MIKKIQSNKILDFITIWIIRNGEYFGRRLKICRVSKASRATTSASRCINSRERGR